MSAAVIRDLLRRRGAEAADSSGVLGVRARPEWTHGPVQVGTRTVPVIACASSLAVREALMARDGNGWLVVLTDRDDDDLGLGITAHFVGRRLQNPDPWDAVKAGFEATAIDTVLATAEQRTELATALLNAAPADGWTPARGGTLTFDHAMASVAAAHLGLSGAEGVIDVAAVLQWSVRDDPVARMANLTAKCGTQLSGLVAGWLAGQSGLLREVVAPLLLEGRSGDLVPLGLVARAVDQARADSGPRALFRRLAGTGADRIDLAGWASAAEECVTALLRTGDALRPQLGGALNRADQLLIEVEARDYVAASPVLRASLTQRLIALGDALFTAVSGATSRAAHGGADAALADAAALPGVEDCWLAVTEHALAERAGERRVVRARAGVQLARWLASPAQTADDLRSAVELFWQTDAWVDRAVNDAASGVELEELARGLRAVLAAVRVRRAAHDQAFGSLIAAHEAESRPAPAGTTYAEDLLRTVVLPLAADVGVLFVLADGMSGGVATEVIDDITAQLDTWVECVPAERSTRLAALAAFPTLTRISRASMFCGELATGEQQVEREGFARLAASAGRTGRLFHKLSLDSSEPGFSIAHDVAAAIDDDKLDVVACVLNTIDDALDRSDPAGTEWSADAVKHLRPLLDRARRAGRTVVIASDHGHVVERREGVLLQSSAPSSNRSARFAGDVPDGTVRMAGPRVLDHDGDALLAVDERIRFGPIKAGYHGGASPAEAVIPVCVLATGAPPSGWQFAPPQSPAWWRGPSAAVAGAPLPPARRSPRGTPAEAPALFEIFASRAGAEVDLVSRLLASQPYMDQRSRARNVQVSDEQVSRLLRALLAAPGHRVDAESAAAELGIATVRLAGALPQVQRVLNVEQYEVIGRDVDGTSIVLDVDLLREQFGLSP